VSGIDIDSDTLIRLAEHPNIVGTKFTCGNVGKLARVASVTQSVSELFPKREAEGSSLPPYFSFAGVADFIASSVWVGGSGAIVGAANVFPRACVNVYNLAVAEKFKEAMEAQQDLARADWSLTKRAIPGFKAILDKFYGYGGKPREPMQSLSEESAGILCGEIAWMMDIENSLGDSDK
jgi:L-threo-3-deoxy-hexylosonate aldolase